MQDFFVEFKSHQASDSREKVIGVMAAALERFREHGRLLVICNISKIGNVSRLIIAALSHNFVPILVGCQSMSSEKLLAGVAAVDPGTQLCRVDSLEELSRWVVETGYTLIGIEITDASEDITEMSLKSKRERRIALMPGNEGTGLTAVQKSCCKEFVYIPQYSATIESFNVAVATATVLHYFVS